MWPRPAAGSLRLRRLPVRAHLGRPPGPRVRRAGGAPGRRRRPDRRPDRARPRAVACRSSPGSPSGSRRARRSSTASWSWSTARAGRTTRRSATRLNGGAGRPVALPRVRHPPPRRRVAAPDAAREASRDAAGACSGRATRSSWCPRSPARVARSTPRSPPRGSPASSRAAGRSPYLPGVRSRLWRSIAATEPGAAPAAAAEPRRRRARDGRHEAAGPRPVLALFRRLPFDEEPGGRAAEPPSQAYPRSVRTNVRDRRRLPVEQHARPVDADREERHDRHGDRRAGRPRGRAPTARRGRPTAAPSSRTGSTAGRTTRTG